MPRHPERLCQRAAECATLSLTRLLVVLPPVDPPREAQRADRGSEPQGEHVSTGTTRGVSLLAR